MPQWNDVVRQYRDDPTSFSPELRQLIEEADPSLKASAHETTIFGVAKQAFEGFVKGVTTFDPFPSDEPQNAAESIAFSVGEVAGFAGMFFNPLGAGAKVGSVALRLAGRSVEAAELATRFGPMFFRAPSLPGAVAGWVEKGFAQAVAKSTYLNSLGWLAKGSKGYHMLSGALSMGVAGAVAAKPITQLDIPDRVNAFLTMAPMGAWNRYLGIEFNKDGKVDVAKWFSIDEKAQSPWAKALGLQQTDRYRIVNNVARALASGISMGSISTLQGAPWEYQVKEYLLNSVFGYSERSHWEAQALEVLHKYNRPGTDFQLMEPEKLAEYPSLSKLAQDYLRYEAEARVGKFEQAASIFAHVKAQYYPETQDAPMEDLAKTMVEDGHLTKEQAADVVQGAEVVRVMNEAENDALKEDVSPEAAKDRALQAGRIAARRIGEQMYDFRRQMGERVAIANRMAKQALLHDELQDYADEKLPGGGGLLWDAYRIVDYAKPTSPLKDDETYESRVRGVIDYMSEAFGGKKSYEEVEKNLLAAYPEMAQNDYLMRTVRRNWWKISSAVKVGKATWNAEKGSVEILGARDALDRNAVETRAESLYGQMLGLNVIELNTVTQQSRETGETEIVPVHESDIPLARIIADMNAQGYRLAGGVKDKSSLRFTQSFLRYREGGAGEAMTFDRLSGSGQTIGEWKIDFNAIEAVMPGFRDAMATMRNRFLKRMSGGSLIHVAEMDKGNVLIDDVDKFEENVDPSKQYHVGFKFDHKRGEYSARVKRLIERMLEYDNVTFVAESKSEIQYLLDRGARVAAMASVDGIVRREGWSSPELVRQYDAMVAENIYAWEMVNGGKSIVDIAKAMKEAPDAKAWLRNVYDLNKRNQLIFGSDVPTTITDGLTAATGGDALRAVLLRVNPDDIRDTYVNALTKKAYDTHLDGVVFLRWDVFDEFAKAQGLSTKIGGMKGSILDADGEKGLLIGKQLFHRASKDLNDRMTTEDIHAHVYTTAAKQYGTRPVMDSKAYWDLSPAKIDRGRADGTVRLYRAEDIPSTEPVEIPSYLLNSERVQRTLAASGRWFTDDPEEAWWYRKNEYPNGRIVYVDVPRGDLTKSRVSNMPDLGGENVAENPRAFSRRPEKEFFLPKEMAAMRRTLEGALASASPATPEHSLTPFVTNIPLKAFRFNPGVFEEPEFILDDTHAVRQVARNIYDPDIQNIWSQLYTKRSFEGSPEGNMLFDKLRAKGGNVTEADLKNLDLRNVHTQTLVDFIYEGRMSPLWSHVVSEVMKLKRGVENTANEDGEFADTEVDVKALQDAISSVRTYLASADPDPLRVLGQPAVRKTLDRMLKRYVMDRVEKPHMPGSMKSISYSEDRLLTKRYGALRPHEYRLSAGWREKPMFFEGEKTTLGDMWDTHEELQQYRKELEAVPPQERTAEQATQHREVKEMLAKFEGAWDHVVIRVPADSPSGVRTMRFKGFTDTPGYGAYLHPEDMVHLGGMDQDGDAVFIYTQLDPRIKNYFARPENLNRRYRYVPLSGKGPTLTAAQYARVGGLDRERYKRVPIPAKESEGLYAKPPKVVDDLRKSFPSMFDPLTLAEVNRDAANGNAMLGFGLNEANAWIAAIGMHGGIDNFPDIETLKSDIVNTAADAASGDPMVTRDEVKYLLEGAVKKAATELGYSEAQIKQIARSYKNLRNMDTQWRGWEGQRFDQWVDAIGGVAGKMGKRMPADSKYLAIIKAASLNVSLRPHALLSGRKHEILFSRMDALINGDSDTAKSFRLLIPIKSLPMGNRLGYRESVYYNYRIVNTDTYAEVRYGAADREYRNLDAYVERDAEGNLVGKKGFKVIPRSDNDKAVLDNEFLFQDSMDLATLVRTAEHATVWLAAQPDMQTGTKRLYDILQRAEDFRFANGERVMAQRGGKRKGQVLSTYDKIVSDMNEYRDGLSKQERLIFDTWFLGSTRTQLKTSEDALAEAQTRLAELDGKQADLLEAARIANAKKAEDPVAFKEAREALDQFARYKKEMQMLLSPKEVLRRWRATNAQISPFAFENVSQEAKTGLMQELQMILGASSEVNTEVYVKRLKAIAPEGRLHVTRADILAREGAPEEAKEVGKMNGVPRAEQMARETVDMVRDVERDAKTERKEVAKTVTPEKSVAELAAAYKKLDAADAQAERVKTLEDRLSRIMERNPNIARDLPMWYKGYLVKTGKVAKSLQYATLDDLEGFVRYFEGRSVMQDVKKNGPRLGRRHFFFMPEWIVQTLDKYDPNTVVTNEIPVLTPGGYVRQSVKYWTSHMGQIFEFANRMHTSNEAAISMIERAVDDEFEAVKQLDRMYNGVGSKVFKIAVRLRQRDRAVDGEKARQQFQEMWNEVAPEWEKLRTKEFRLVTKDMKQETFTGEQLVRRIGEKIGSVIDQVWDEHFENAKSEAELLVERRLGADQEGNVHTEIDYRATLKKWNELVLSGRFPKITLNMMLRMGYQRKLDRMFGNLSDGEKIEKRYQLMQAGKWNEYQPVSASREEAYSYFPLTGHDAKLASEWVYKRVEKLVKGDAIPSDLAREQMSSILGYARSHSRDGGMVEGFFDRVLDGMEKYDPKKDDGGVVTTWTPGHLKNRGGDEFGLMPGWMETPDALKRYAKQAITAKHNMMFALMADATIRHFEKEQVFGERTQEWAQYMKLYVRANIGQPSTIPEEFLKNENFKRAVNPYYYFTDQFFKDRMGTVLGKMLGVKLGLKPGEPLNKEALAKLGGEEYLMRKLTHWSNLEGKIELITLLSHTKTMVNNVVGGNVNLAIEVGLNPWRKTFSLNSLRDVMGPSVKTWEDVWNFVEAHGGVETFVKQQVDWNPELQSERWTKALSEMVAEVKSNKKYSDANLKAIAARHGITDAMFEKAAWFMKTTEIRNRRRAWLAGYLKAREVFDATPAAFPDAADPMLVEMANKTVNATQFLYNNATRPLFATTNVGKIFSRFQMYALNSINLRKHILERAAASGYDPNSEDGKRMSRMAVIDLFVLSLATLYPASVFDANLNEPYKTLQGVTQMLFGDDKQRKEAFFGTLPYPANLLQPISPPVSRFLYPAINGLMTGEWDKFTSYQVWTYFPFGRLAKDAVKTVNNPTHALDNMFGLPTAQIARKNNRIEDRVRLDGILGLIGSVSGLTSDDESSTLKPNTTE